MPPLNISLDNYILAGILNECIYFFEKQNVEVLITPTFIIEPYKKSGLNNSIIQA
jgi:hypothetical protein